MFPSPGSSKGQSETTGDPVSPQGGRHPLSHPLTQEGRRCLVAPHTQLSTEIIYHRPKNASTGVTVQKPSGKPSYYLKRFLPVTAEMIPTFSTGDDGSGQGEESGTFRASCYPPSFTELRWFHSRCITIVQVSNTMFTRLRPFSLTLHHTKDHTFTPHRRNARTPLNPVYLKTSMCSQTTPIKK